MSERIDDILDFWFGNVTEQTPLSGDDPRVKNRFSHDDAFDA